MRRRFFLFTGTIAAASFLFLGGWKAGQFYFEFKDAKKAYVLSTSEIPSLENLLKSSNCGPKARFFNPDDARNCFGKLKLTESRGVEIDLSKSKIFLVDGGKIVKILPVAYQSPEGKWFQTPTGYYRIGAKHENHASSLFPVKMNYAVQLYEDFFVHEIPSYLSGEKVTSTFSGGCIRLETDVAKEFYDFAKKGYLVIIYKNSDNLEPQREIYPPVKIKDYWIRQRFNNPYRQFWNTIGGTAKDRKNDYYQHTGTDFAPNPGADDLNAYAALNGIVAKIQPNNGNDHGLGNTIILEHEISGQKIYSLYAHLDSVKTGLKEGDSVSGGKIIGKIGNSGYGCQNFWKVGRKPDRNACDNEGTPDIHLHFEIKKGAVLENPEKGEDCKNNDGSVRFCYGYTPDSPTKYGYINPILFLFNFKSE